jgi:hypothetical protein
MDGRRMVRCRVGQRTCSPFASPRGTADHRAERVVPMRRRPEPIRTRRAMSAGVNDHSRRKTAGRRGAVHG